MSIPYVIDNQTYRLADILNALLAKHQGRSLNVATGYFTVGEFGLHSPHTLCIEKRLERIL